MADRLRRDGFDIHGVHHGPAAAAALVGAFLSARGHFTMEVSIGFEGRRPDTVLILIELLDVKAVFTPAELHFLGRGVIDGIPMARRLGASEVDAIELERFAEMLIRNADEAMTTSPHGLH